MKKAIIFIPIGLVAGGMLYQLIKAHRVTAGLAGRYPAMSIWGQIKRGRTRYVRMGR